MTDRLAAELKKWRLPTVFGDDEDLVLARPELGTPLDRTKVTRRFQAACDVEHAAETWVSAGLQVPKPGPWR